MEIDSVADYFDMIDALDDPIDRIIKEVKKKARATEEAKLLMTKPGGGLVWSLTITTEIGDIGGFSGPKETYSCAGIVPSTKESGSRSVHGSIPDCGLDHGPHSKAE